jgi:putative serine protease PepD
VLGAGVMTGLLYALGVAGGSSVVTNTVQQTAPVSGGSGSSASFNPSAIYAGAAPGVVAITASGISSGSGGFPFGGQSQSVATGTGFEIDSKGNLLTAAHVVSGASSVTVKFQDGTTRTAKVLGSDNSTDVAVLQVNPSGLTLHPLSLASSKSLAVGNPLAVIGDPFGYSRSLSTGVVSALDRTIQAPDGFTVAHAIQTDAAVNPGNSGGPLLDARGQVVGIVDQIATGSGGSTSSTGVGFAVPVDVVQSELSQLGAGQHVAHAYLGVSTSQASAQQGALVAGVAAGSPAAAAGLRAGDVITAINGNAVTASSQIVSGIAALKPGDNVTITVQRGSKSVALTARIGTQPSQAPAA